MGFPILGGFCSLNGESPCSFWSLLDFLKAHWHFLSTTFGLQKMLPFEHSLQLLGHQWANHICGGAESQKHDIGLGGKGGLHSTRWWCHIPDPCTFPSTLGDVSLVAFLNIFHIFRDCVLLCWRMFPSVYISGIGAFMCPGQVTFIWVSNESLGVVVWGVRTLRNGKHFRVANEYNLPICIFPFTLTHLPLSPPYYCPSTSPTHWHTLSDLGRGNICLHPS